MFDCFASAYNKTLNTADNNVALTDEEIGFTPAQVDRANRARIGVHTQSVRIALQPVASDATASGILYASGSVVIVEGTNNLAQMTIRAVTNGAVVNVELEE